MSTKLIWQSKDNPLDTIEVVYDSIYGMSIDECMEVLWKYRSGQLIPIERVKKGGEQMIDDWLAEQIKNGENERD